MSIDQLSSILPCLMARLNSEIHAEIDALEEFADAYRFYFGAPDAKGDLPREFVGNRATLRQLILRKLGPAEAIMTRVGTNGIGVLPPPAIGGPGLRGLSALAFADEQSLYQRASPPLHQIVLDAVERSIGLLQHELQVQGTSSSSPRLPSSRWRLRFPRLILDRILRHVPRWASAIERIILLSAGIAAIVGVVGTALGWWSDPGH